MNLWQDFGKTRTHFRPNAKKPHPKGCGSQRFVLFSGSGIAIAIIEDFEIIVIVAAAVAIVAIAFVIAVAEHTQFVAENVAQKSYNADKSNDAEDDAEDGSGFLTHNNTPF